MPLPGWPPLCSEQRYVDYPALETLKLKKSVAIGLAVYLCFGVRQFGHLFNFMEFNQ
jgi:hypothetical protein